MKTDENEKSKGNKINFDVPVLANECWNFVFLFIDC